MVTSELSPAPDKNGNRSYMTSTPGFRRSQRTNRRVAQRLHQPATAALVGRTDGPNETSVLGITRCRAWVPAPNDPVS